MDINYYNNYYKKAKAYKDMVDYSLCFLSKSFGIEGLADNKQVNGKDYITVDEDTDTMVIQSLFNKYNEYVIPRVSTVSLYDKIGSVDAEEIKYLKDKFTRIGNFYMQPDFGEDYEISFDVNRGLFCVIVKVRDPFVTDRPLCRKFTTSLMILAKRDNITSVAHDVFDGIRNELLGRLNKEKVVAGKIEDFKPVGLVAARGTDVYYDEVVKHSLHYLSKTFHIDYLMNNKRPMDGKEYVTVDVGTDTLIIQSLFNRYNDYVIPRVSAVDLDSKLSSVYAEEIGYLRDKFTRVGEFYDTSEFLVFNVSCMAHDDRFTIIVNARDSFAEHPLWRERKTTLELLSRNSDLTTAAHDMLKNIHDELVEHIYKNMAKTQLSSFCGMSGGDFDGDVLYKDIDERIKAMEDEFIDRHMTKIELNSIYGVCADEYEFSEKLKRVNEIARNYKGGYMRDYTSMYGKTIKKVIFNDPATIVMWNDGTKTVVKKHGDVEFNGEAAVMYAYVLRWHFNNNRKSMRIWLKQNAKRFEWQSDKPKKITVTRTSKGKITKASQREIYDAMTPEQKEIVDAMIQDAVKESKKGGKNEGIR